jgi:nucleoid-associated protein YgaU
MKTLLVAALSVPLATQMCSQQPRAELEPVPPPPSFDTAGAPGSGPTWVPAGGAGGPDAAGVTDDPAMDPVGVTDNPAMDPVGIEQASPPGAGAASGGRTYTVQRGDTLWRIAQRVYGNGQRWQDIADANPQINPQQLSIGDELVLPD